MTYLTKNGMLAVVAGGLVAAGMIIVLQGDRGRLTTGFDTPTSLSAAAEAGRSAPRANGTVPAVETSPAVAVSAVERTARAGEPAADLVSPAEPAVALARGRGTGL